MLRNWRDFLFYYWVLLYDKIVFRELIYNTSEEEKALTQEKLKESCDTFIKDTQKKKYRFSCCSLCCAKRKDYESKNEWGKSKGFFCSQLVAAAYSYCGILKINKSSKKYLPGSFSSMSNDLELNEKYSLGPEIIIDFTTYN
jgi:hypothetical protein